MCGHGVLGVCGKGCEQRIRCEKKSQQPCFLNQNYVIAGHQSGLLSPILKIKSFINKGNSLSERTHLFNLAKTRAKLLAKLTLCPAPLGSMCKPSQMERTHAGNKPTPGEDPSWASALLLSLLSSLLPSTRTKIQSSCLGLQYMIPSEGSCAESCWMSAMPWGKLPELLPDGFRRKSLSVMSFLRYTAYMHTFLKTVCTPFLAPLPLCWEGTARHLYLPQFLLPACESGILF